MIDYYTEIAEAIINHENPRHAVKVLNHYWNRNRFFRVRKRRVERALEALCS